MSEILQHMITVFLGFFAIMNPLANTAVFEGLVGDQSASEQRAIAIKSLLIAFCIVLAFAALGKTIFHLFGITLPALRITGGVLVFLIGFGMVHGNSSPHASHSAHDSSDETSSDVAISPLAVPILAGPGTIATTMNFSAAGNWSDIIITVLTFGAMCMITFGCFISGQRLVGLLGHSGMVIVSRIMGLILAVIGTQMMIEGVLDVVNYHEQLIQSGD